jgi:hypothetical protein
VNTYVWYDAGAKNIGASALALNSTLNSVALGNAVIPGLPTSTALYGNVNVVDNRPYSKRVNQLNLDADYAIAAGHSVRVGFDWQKTDRYCSGTWIDCSFADSAFETTEIVTVPFSRYMTLSATSPAAKSTVHNGELSAQVLRKPEAPQD